jgi:hypothetical protein
MDSKPVLINFSGHPLSAESTEELSKQFRAIETIAFEAIRFGEDIEPQLKSIVNRVKTPLDGSIPISVILPGHSTLAVLLLVYLLGLIGAVPNLCVMEPTGFGRYHPSSIFHIDIQKLRGGARAFRQEILGRRTDG